MTDRQHFDSDDPGPVVVLGLTWLEGIPRLRMRRPDEDSQLFELTGSVLRYQATNTTHCVGFGVQVASSYSDCHKSPQPGERTCVSCSVAEANHASGLHHAHTKDPAVQSSTMASHLQQPNSLYLAMFRDGSVKVGTTTSRRHTTRLLEQGAWMARTVATTSDGIEIRKLEDLVTEQLGVPQSVSIKRKLSGLATPSDEKILASKLDEKAAEVQRLLSSGSSLVTDSTKISPTNDIWRFTDTLSPGATASLVDSPYLYSAPLNQDHHHIEITGNCGRIAVVTKPDSNDRFLVDLGQLFGVELSVGDHEPAEITVQDSLF